MAVPVVAPPSRDRVVRWAVTLGVLGAVAAFLLATGPTDGWRWRRVWGDGDRVGWRDAFLAGLWVTLRASAGALVVAVVVGFAAGMARLSPRAWLSQLATVYVELVRGTPLLVQLFVAMYCVGYSMGVDDRLLVGTVTLGVFAGAYVTEVVRAAVQSVDAAQTEAALSQGMTRRQTMRHVVLPQALRRMLPPLAGEFVSLVKDSSLLSAIGVLELSKRAMEAQADTYRTYEVYLPLAALYLAITFPLSRWVRRLELRSAAP
ncbi:MAG: amino acid ABC transporter permease [Planctomycetia bacterium]|nr:amino acid ABC transporter permease [Planctomycetia bacterium]